MSSAVLITNTYIKPQSITEELKQINEHIRLLIIFAKFEDRFENKGVTAVFPSNQHAPYLAGKCIDKETRSDLERQLQGKLESIARRIVTLEGKATAAARGTKRITIKPELPNNVDEKVGTFSLPFFITDLMRNFFSHAKLGCANAVEYVQNGHPEVKYVDGSDVDAVKSLYSSVYGTPPSDEDISNHDCKQLLNMLIHSGVTNKRTLNSLFQIYNKHNRLKDDSNKRNLIDEHFEKNILNMKVDWTVDGKRVVEDAEINPLRMRMSSVIDRFNIESEKLKKAENDCKTWQKADAKSPVSKKAKSAILHDNNRYDDLYNVYNTHHKAVVALLVESGEITHILFPDCKLPSYTELAKSSKLLDLKTSISILKKVNNHGKTFRQVLEEKRPKDALAEGMYWDTLLAVVMAYVAIPDQVLQTKLDITRKDFIKTKKVITKSVEIDLFFKSLKLAYE